MQQDLLIPTSGVQIDTLQMQGGKMVGHGGVATRLLQSDFNVNALRTNEILRKDEWVAFDEALIEVAHTRLNGVGKLIERNLTFNIGNALGTTILEWESLSDFEPAELSMSGVTEGERDRVEFTLQSMPLPIIHKDFELNVRHLNASRSRGQSIDTVQVEQATRVVAETIEQLLFLGNTSKTVLGGTIPGLLTETNRNTDTQAANWDTTATGAQFIADILTQIGQLQADNMYGPYGLFVTYATFNRMSDDYKADSDKTTIQRILEIPGIEFVEPVTDMTAANSALVQMTSDVVQEVIGLQPTLVQWETMGGMKAHFKVMAIMLPRVRSTSTLQSGIVHGSP